MALFLEQIRRTALRLAQQKTGVTFSFLDSIYDGVFGKTTSRWTILLPGAGCEWARKKHKGCSFCAFNQKIDQVSGGRLISHWEMMGVMSLARSVLDGRNPELVSLFNGGNFINDKEIVPRAQIGILGELAKIPSVKKILFETKTEYMTDEKLDAVLAAAGGKTLRVAIGLECQDDFLRNKIINKGMTKGAYERAIKKLHGLGMEVQSYVFIKPMTISEKRAIQEGIDTIRYAADSGSDTIMVESAMVQEGTRFYEAYRKGEFAPPWLWSLREIVARTRDLKAVNVGIFDEVPAPIAGPKNCPRCSQRFLEAFRIFRETHDDDPLLSLECECRAEWEKAVA